MRNMTLKAEICIGFLGSRSPSSVPVTPTPYTDNQDPAPASFKKNLLHSVFICHSTTINKSTRACVCVSTNRDGRRSVTKLPCDWDRLPSFAREKSIHSRTSSKDAMQRMVGSDSN